MSNGLKALSGALAESELATTVVESAEHLWLAGLGAYALAQEESVKVFEALVKEGEIVQARTRKLADRKIADIASKAADTFDRLERALADRVAHSLSTLGVPSKHDINRLSRNVQELSSMVHELAQEKAGGKPAAMAVKHLGSPAVQAEDRQFEHLEH
jgi:poly(hydroxyalkanoate) granule-associated protein